MLKKIKGPFWPAFVRILQPRSMLARLFLFLAIGICISNLLFILISDSRDHEKQNNYNAYRLGFQLEHTITAFLYRPSYTLEKSADLTWRIFEVGDKPIATVFEEAGISSWKEQPVFLPPSTDFQPTKRVKISLFTRQPLYLNSSEYTQGNYHGRTTLTEALATLSERISQSSKDAKLVLFNENSNIMVVSSPRYWQSETTLAHYDFLLYVALVLFFMSIPFAAGMILSPIDALLEELKEKHDYSSPIVADGCMEVSEISSSINQLIEELKQHNNDRISFVAAISHDLGVPATRLRLRASMINDRDLRNRLLNDTNEMSAMIEDSLHYLRNESMDEQARVVDFTSLVESLQQDYLDIGKQVFFEAGQNSDQAEHSAIPFQTVPSVFSGAATQFNYHQRGPITLNCKPRAIRRAISNLVDNSIKYADAALIELESDSSSVVIRVSDQGPGVPDDELEKILQPFYRIEKSRQRRTGGTGLGLAIVHRIVKDHNGFLALENVPTGGLQVTIALPRDVPNHF